MTNQVDVIAMALGLPTEPKPVAQALTRARSLGIVALASASNDGANNRISFPASLDDVFCIGSANGKGGRSHFSPPFIGEEKYSALGEGVYGAVPTQAAQAESFGRKSGTSTAVMVAAGIVALLMDYTRQFLEVGQGADNWVNLRKLFLKMSEATAEEAYRFLSPQYLFTLAKDIKGLIKLVIRKPAGTAQGNTSDKYSGRQAMEFNWYFE